jgi:hypothetical protein
MIQGVHAETLTFVALERLTELLEAGLWASGDSRSNQTQLALMGRRARFIVRLGAIRATAKMTVCSLQLETPEEKFQPKLRAALEFTRVPINKNRTKIRLDGSAAARLVDGPEMTSTDEIRRMGNDLARQLLGEIAARAEKLADKVETRRAPKIELQRAGQNA